MNREYWRDYYRKNSRKIRKQKKVWRRNNTERVKEINKTCREKHIDQYRERARECYKTWINFEHNKQHKKEYQRIWQKSKREISKEDQQELNEIIRALETNRATINGYGIELKQDKGGMWFYYILENKNLVYISDKFQKRIEAIKDLQYAI